MYKTEVGNMMTIIKNKLSPPEITLEDMGGMSEDEIARMKDANCQSVTLGPRILRTETAGLCANSALMCLYGEME